MLSTSGASQSREDTGEVHEPFMIRSNRSCEIPSPRGMMKNDGSAHASDLALLVREGSARNPISPEGHDSGNGMKAPLQAEAVQAAGGGGGGGNGVYDGTATPPPMPEPPMPPPPPVPKRLIGKFKHAGCFLFSPDACHSIFLIVFILAGSLIFLTSVVKKEEVYSIVIVTVLTALSLSFLICAVSIDPGIVPAVPCDQAAVGDVRVTIKDMEVLCKVCPTCHIVRPPRSSHCRFCDVCVEEYDHHCGVLGSCVGRRTYRFFAGFFIITIFLSLYVLIRCIVMLAMFDYKTQNRDASGRWRVAASALCLAGGAFGALFTAPFAGKYIFMSCVNTTEKELLRTRKGKICSPNEPYHEGYCTNVVKRFFSPLPRSKVRGREDEYV